MKKRSLPPEFFYYSGTNESNNPVKMENNYPPPDQETILNVLRSSPSIKSILLTSSLVQQSFSKAVLNYPVFTGNLAMKLENVKYYKIIMLPFKSRNDDEFSIFFEELSIQAAQKILDFYNEHHSDVKAVLKYAVINTDGPLMIKLNFKETTFFKQVMPKLIEFLENDIQPEPENENSMEL